MPDYLKWHFYKFRHILSVPQNLQVEVERIEQGLRISRMREQGHVPKLGGSGGCPTIETSVYLDGPTQSLHLLAALAALGILIR